MASVAEIALESMRAIHQLLRRFTVPLLGKEYGEVVHLGTGTFFRVNGKHYLITAAHVFEDADPNEVGIPIGEPAVRTLGPTAKYALDPQTDVAAVVIEDGETIRHLEDHARFTCPEDLRAVSGTERGFLIAGYMSATTRQVGKTLIGDFNTILGEPFDGPSSDLQEPVDLEVDLFIQHTKTAVTLNARREEMPSLRGISGASVWAVLSDEPQGHVWSLKDRIKLVAVETAYRPGIYIRAKKWNAVGEVLRQIDAVGADRVVQALKSP